MKNFCRPALLLPLLLLARSSASAAPVLPTTLHTQWHYHVTGGSHPTTVVQIVAQEEIGGRPVLKVETRAGNELVKTEWLAVNDSGLLCHRRTWPDGKTATFDPPQTLIPMPLKVGSTWEFQDQIDGAPAQQLFTVAAEEKLTVPAGRFRAYRLVCEQPWPISTTIERWFVPGTGVVKDSTTTRGPTGRLLSRTTSVLKNVTVAPPPPREEPSVEITNGAAPSPPASVAPVATATPPAATPAPTRVALEVSDSRDAEPAGEYKSDTPELFISWGGENLPPEAEVRVAWVAEDVGDIVPPDFVVDESRTIATTPDFSARFTLSRPKDGWAAGRYRAELYVNDTLAAEAKVTIRD